MKFFVKFSSRFISLLIYTSWNSLLFDQIFFRVAAPLPTWHLLQANNIPFLWALMAGSDLFKGKCSLILETRCACISSVLSTVAANYQIWIAYNYLNVSYSEGCQNINLRERKLFGVVLALGKMFACPPNEKCPRSLTASKQGVIPHNTFHSSSQTTHKKGLISHISPRADTRGRHFCSHGNRVCSQTVSFCN